MPLSPPALSADQRRWQRRLRQPLWDARCDETCIPAAQLPDNGDPGRLLEQHPPFRLAGRLNAFSPAAAALRSDWQIPPAKDLYEGHFPQRPLLPGVLLVESLAQLSLCLARLRAGSTAAPPAITGHGSDTLPPLLLRIRHSEFLRLCQPGENVQLVVRLLEETPPLMTVAGQVWLESTLCAVVCLEVMIDG